MPRSPDEAHVWVTAACVGPKTLTARLSLPARLAVVDAHARHRGPYTAAGALLREIVPEVVRRRPDLVVRHHRELLTAAPELEAFVPGHRTTLAWAAAAAEVTRNHRGSRTAHIAHGLVDFLTAWLRSVDHGPRALVIRHAACADPTDAELLAILLRRMRPSLLRLVVCAGDDAPADLLGALGRHAVRMPEPSGSGSGDEGGTDPRTLAAQYIAGDCTSEDLALRAAYDALTAGERIRLHDLRADVLEAAGEPSLHLGAIPFHRERGRDPIGAGVQALRTALEHCVRMGLHHAVVDLGTRSLALLDWATTPEQCCEVCSQVATALTALGHTAQAAALYDLACANSALPSLHMQSALGRALLHVRSCEEDQCDHEEARLWMNTAVAMARLVPESQRQGLGLSLDESAVALIEWHVGDPAKALARVTRAVRRDDQDADAAAQTPHRALLLHQRAGFLAAIGSPEEALRAYGEAIAAAPQQGEPYFERARTHWRLGRHADALADYDMAIALSPPSAEAHFERGRLAMETGDHRRAAREFSRVLELEPDRLDALVHRAGVFVELGDLDPAARDVSDGLRLDRTRADLHCLRGVIALQSGRPEEAGEAFEETLRADPTLVAGWTHRAALRFADGDIGDAIEDLTEALRIGGEDPAIRADRGLVNERAGRLTHAIADYSAALEHPGADHAQLTYRRGRCLVRAGRPAFARADLVRCLGLGDSETAGLARAELELLGPQGGSTLSSRTPISSLSRDRAPWRINAEHTGLGRA
jgi:tetratricopeptide (TPR) repeat protein